MLWFALTLLAACAGVLVALPFLRTRVHNEAPAKPEGIYRSQLESLDRDEAAGDLDAGAATRLRTEIERRILEAPTEREAAVSSAGVDRITAAVVAAIVVLGSVALYAATSSPRPSGASSGPDIGGQMQTLPEVEAMIESLRARLEESPNDPEGWRMLGWSYFETGRYDLSVGAYRQAVALAPDNAEYRSGYGEALTWANQTTVASEASEQFRTALQHQPNDERARYYLALEKAQRGDLDGAVEDWLGALRDAEPSSEWAARMRADAENVAREAGIDISGRLPPIPSATDAASAAPPHPSTTMSQDDAAEAQQAMIAGMVDRLEQRLNADPRDAEGWVRLMRSRMVLGQSDQAADALSRALAAFRGDRQTQQRLRTAAADLGIREVN